MKSEGIDYQMVFDVEIQFIKWGLEDLGIKLPAYLQ